MMGQKFVYNDVTQKDVNNGIISTLRDLLNENGIEITSVYYDIEREVLTLYIIDKSNRDQDTLFKLKRDIKDKAYASIKDKTSDDVIISESRNRYYDPEYDRIVDEDVIKNQYEWFSKQKWFKDTYEQFRDSDFRLLSDDSDEELLFMHGNEMDD